MKLILTAVTFALVPFTIAAPAPNADEILVKVSTKHNDLVQPMCLAIGKECDFDEDCCSGFCKFNAKVGSHCYGLKGTTTKSAIAGILGLAKEDEHEQAQKSVAQQADQLAAAKPPACLPDGEECGPDKGRCCHECVLDNTYQVFQCMRFRGPEPPVHVALDF